MDVLLLVISVLVGFVATVSIIADGFTQQTRRAILGVAILLILSSSIFWLSFHFSQTTSVEKFDVVKYGNTEYSEPKTIVETTTIYPWWSALENSTIYVVDGEITK